MYLKPKKSLGQNFLIDKNIQRKIIDACKLKASDIVLEIGAGRGELTAFLVDKVNKIYALEIDFSLYQVLRDRFRDYANIDIINRDILKFNLRKEFSKYKNKIKIIGNIPYYITTPILGHLLKFRHKIDTIFITLQKEFAKRMIAKPGTKDYGAFSCFIQYYAQAQIIFFIKKNCFSPRPKVDSCFVQLEIRQKPPVKIKDEKLLFKIIRLAFNKRRKTLRNSLKGVISEQKLETFFHKYGIDKKIRPEDLRLVDFANLSYINNH